MAQPEAKTTTTTTTTNATMTITTAAASETTGTVRSPATLPSLHGRLPVAMPPSQQQQLTQQEEEQDVVGQVDDDDVTIFGNINASLADALATFVQTAIHAGVQSLPLLQDSDRSKQLLQTTIERAYWKYIDLMEVYGERNIFTLRPFPIRRRQQILKRWQTIDADDDKNNNKHNNKTTHNSNESIQEETEDNVQAKDANNDIEIDVNVHADTEADADAGSPVAAPTSNDVSTGTTSQNVIPIAIPIQFPKTLQEIPSPDELTRIQDEVSTLSAQWKVAIERRNALIQRGAFLTTVQATTTKVIESLDQSELFPPKDDTGTMTAGTGSMDLVQNAVTAAVMGGQGLQELTQEGKRLQSVLEERKRRQEDNIDGKDGDDEDDDDDVYRNNRRMGSPLMPPPARKKRTATLSMREMYQQDRQTITTSVENLASLSNLLKENNNNNNKSRNTTTNNSNNKSITNEHESIV